MQSRLLLRMLVKMKLTKLVNRLLGSLSKKYLIDMEQITDGYHTFNELYEYRTLYNALYVNEIAAQQKYPVYKTVRHNDGELCFDGGWFVVVVELPTGIVDNHYELKYWNLFKCPVVEKVPHPFDGHTPQDVAHHMKDYLEQKK